MLLLAETALAITALPGVQDLAGTVGMWTETPTKLFRLIQTPHIHALAMTTEWCSIGGGIATTGSLGQLPRSSRAYTAIASASDL